MTKFFALLFLLILPPVNATELLFSPVVVEDKEVEPSTKQITINPYAGTGAKNLLIPTNKFNIEITNLEQEPDISNLRRNQYFFFNNAFLNKKKAILAKVEWGKEQSFHLKSKKRRQIEAMVKRNHGSYQFIDNNNTPFTKNDDYQNHYRKKEEHYFLSFHQSKFLSEFDHHHSNTIAGTQVTGHQKEDRFEANIGHQFYKLNQTFFVSYQENKFDAYDPNLFNNKTQISRLLMHGEMKLFQRALFFYDLGQESWKRTFTELPRSNFSRHYLKTKLIHTWSQSRWFETKMLAQTCLLGDREKTTSTMELKGEVTSGTQYPLGIILLANYYERAPKPSLIFGDGASLMPNQNLKVEHGFRAQLGPWYKVSQFEGKIQFFLEDSKNSPVTVGIAPTKAKTLSIDGIWTRGFLISNHFKTKNLILNLEYQYQQALNNSSINWQQGNPIPERPRHLFKTGFELLFNRIHLGLNFKAEKEKYRDLAGMDQAPSLYSTDAFVRYTLQKSQINLQFNNIFLSDSWKEVRSFQDSAGSNILEPLQNQPEIKISWEYLI